MRAAKKKIPLWIFSGYWDGNNDWHDGKRYLMGVVARQPKFTTDQKFYLSSDKHFETLIARYDI